MKAFLFAVGLLGFVGCSSRPASHPPVDSVPPARRFERQLLRPSPHRNCAITIVREPGVSGAGLNLFLDGEQIVRLAAGESLTVYVAPGRHVLTARPLFSPPPAKRLLLRAHESAVIRVIDRNGNFELVSADRGWLKSVGRSVHSLFHHGES